jgi:hypothetical protein
MRMQNFRLSSRIVTNISCCFLLGAVGLGYAPTSYGQSSCDSEVLEVGRDITERINAHLVKINKQWINDSSNPFSSRYYELVFVFSSDRRDERFAKSQALMGSFKLQEKYATSILKSCDSLAKVTFGMNASGDIIDWYIMPNGDIKRGVCLPPRQRSILIPWGFNVCV